MKHCPNVRTKAHYVSPAVFVCPPAATGTLAMDLERGVGRELDESIEEDIAEYQARESEYRKKNKWSMFSMLLASV
jgi:hypothetical protein